MQFLALRFFFRTKQRTPDVLVRTFGVLNEVLKQTEGLETWKVLM